MALSGFDGLGSPGPVSRISGALWRFSDGGSPMHAVETCWRAAMLHRCAFEGCPKTVEWPEVFLVAARGLVVGRRCDVLQASWRRGLQGDIGKRRE